MKSLPLQFLVGVLCAAFVVTLYHRLWVTPAMAIAVVDIAAVYNAKQAEFANSIIKDGSPAQRDKAMGDAKAFAARLPRAYAELAAECQCLLVDRSVIIGARVPLVDLTDDLKKKVQ